MRSNAYIESAICGGSITPGTVGYYQLVSSAGPLDAILNAPPNTWSLGNAITNCSNSAITEPFQVPSGALFTTPAIFSTPSDNKLAASFLDTSGNASGFNTTINSTANSGAGAAVRNLTYSGNSSQGDIVIGPSSAAPTALILKAAGSAIFSTAAQSPVFRTGVATNLDAAESFTLTSGQTAPATSYAFTGTYATIPNCDVHPINVTPAASQAYSGLVPQITTTTSR